MTKLIPTLSHICISTIRVSYDEWDGYILYIILLVSYSCTSDVSVKSYRYLLFDKDVISVCLQVLLEFMSMPLLRESACDCILDVINKGMEPVAKTKLIESFTSILQNRGIFNIQEVMFKSVNITEYRPKERNWLHTLCDSSF